jgi:hypothetical protein
VLRSEATSQSSIYLSLRLIKLIFWTLNIKKIKPGSLKIVSCTSGKRNVYQRRMKIKGMIVLATNKTNRTNKKMIKTNTYVLYCSFLFVLFAANICVFVWHMAANV